MPADEQSQFLQELAADLNSRDIELPSFPEVVIHIRKVLEDPTCNSDRLADVVRTDAVLVARLLMSANSSFHNRAGIEIVDLNLSISRLGFEVVRNTAIALAVEQIFVASEHEDLNKAVKEIWGHSLSLASMSFVIATRSGSINPDNAFLCGLFHEIGKLYLLTKARNYPVLMGDEESLGNVLEQWNASVGKSIIEAWGFSPDIAASVDPDENMSADQGAASLVDVVFLAKLVLSDSEAAAANDAFAGPASKLEITADTIPALHDAYNLHVQSMRQ